MMAVGIETVTMRQWWRDYYANRKVNAVENYQGPGIYTHYKGSRYHVLGLSVDENTKGEGWDGAITRAVYVPLSPGSLLPGPEGQTMWARPLNASDAAKAGEPGCEFNGFVYRPGGIVPRFVKKAGM